MNEDFDRQMMRRAIELAMRGRGAVEPNPMVGCVIVREGRIIGEGWHRAFGQAHAEPDALSRCAESTEGATAYVTLEPCCHTGKKTPPCVPRLIQAKLMRVVVGATDPNPQVSGRGVAQLRSAGIAVDTGVLADECRQLIAAFTAWMTLGRGYVTLKWAQSADGRVAGAGGARVQISNERAMRLVHELRARCDAILIGIGTALSDDPMLTARRVASVRPIVRVVLDSHLRLPASAQLVRTARQVPTLAYCDAAAIATMQSQVTELTNAGVSVVPVAREGPGLSLAAVLADLHARHRPTHVMVEPGPTLARSFIEQNLADRIWIFRSSRRIDDSTAPAAASVPYPPVGSIELEGDTLTEYLNPASPVFHLSAPSADFVLARNAVET